MRRRRQQRRRTGGTAIQDTAATAATTATAAPTASTAIVPGDDLEQMLHRLLSQAYLFDDPAAYEAGVRDAYELLSRPFPVARAAA